VAFLFGNGPEIAFSYYACWKIGAIAAPLNIRFAPPELAYVLGHCQAKVVLGQAQLCRALMPLRPELPYLKAVYVSREPLDSADRFEALFEAAGATDPLPAVGDGDVALVMYTSGTTAKPKGVIHTHGALRQQRENFHDALDAELFERTTVMMPMFHISGFFTVVLATGAGGSMWTLRRFDPEQALVLLEASRATFSAALPIQVKALVDHPRAAQFDVGALKAFLCGGDCVSHEVQDRFKTLFGVSVDEICGMTELFYTIQPLRSGARRPGTIGKPMGDVSIALLDRAGEPVAEGEVGEIVVQSAGMTPGYWNDPASTAATIRDGWLWTGDLGSRDADGYYRFEGRSKDLIVRGGSNVSPVEVEDVLIAHPAVADVGVVGAPDRELGQVVWAYVALKAGAQEGAAELKAWAAERIAAYKVPERILFVDAVPKGVTGKVDRKGLREGGAVEREPAPLDA
jgi:acyl-CoA synthetase (AMP-forming)/AMP-acid ligase II